MPLTTLPYTIHASLHLQVKEAKKYYPLFGMFANVALVFSGQFVRYVSQMKARLPMGVDPWGVALNYLMSAVCLSGAVTMGCYRYLAKNVRPTPNPITLTLTLTSAVAQHRSLPAPAQRPCASPSAPHLERHLDTPRETS